MLNNGSYAVNDVSNKRKHGLEHSKDRLEKRHKDAKDGGEKVGYRGSYRCHYVVPRCLHWLGLYRVSPAPSNVIVVTNKKKCLIANLSGATEGIPHNSRVNYCQTNMVQSP